MIFAGLTVLGLVLVAGAAYYKFTDVRPAHGGSINIAIVGSPRFINPVLDQVNEADQDIADIVFSSLMEYDGNGNLVNDLLDKYAIGDEGKTYDVTIKPGVLWQDKKPLTVDDIIFTIQTIQNPEFSSPIRPLWQGIEMEKISDLIIRFKLKNVYVSFLNNLTFGILPKHLWENIAPSQFALNEMNLKPIGSGPYKFSKFQKDSQGLIKTIKFDAFKDYFKDESFISSLTFKFYANENDALTAYKKGEVDIVSFASAKNFMDFKNKDNGDYNVYALQLPRYFAVFFNQTQNKFLTDKNVRLALNLATNKKEIIDTVFGGYAQQIDSPLPAKMFGYPDDQSQAYPFSLQQAKDLLASAGYTDTNNDGFLEKDQQALELTLTSIDWPELTQTADILKNQWAALGVKTNISIVGTDKIQNDIIKPRQFQALLFGEVLGPEPDLFHFWHSTQTKDLGLNLALYQNPDVDNLLSSALSDLDKNSRIQKKLKAAGLIVADAPTVFLFSPDYILLTHKNIQGINLKNIDIPASLFAQINQWYLKTHRTWK